MENLDTEAQECLVSLMMEPYPQLVDDLADSMSTTEAGRSGIDGSMAVSTLQQHIEQDYPWALSLDWQEPKNCARAWYVSEEKLEPRLGRRHEEAGAEREMPLDIARRVHALANALREGPHDESVAEFLLRKPEHRYAVSRVQTQHHHPYSEIRDNLIAGTALPIDMLRAKLSFFGAAKFDPRSTLWTRITLYQGAPLPNEITTTDADDWWLPVMDGAS